MRLRRHSKTDLVGSTSASERIRSVGILISALVLGPLACDAGVGPSPLPTRPIVFAAQSTTTSCNSIWLIQPDGTGLTELTKTPGCKATPAVSPDGSHIAFAADGPPLGLYVMTLDGTHVQALETSDNIDWYPAWSPDGTQLAFVSNSRGGDTTSSLWVMKADGSAAHHIVTPGRWPTWSPDGRQLAYEGGDCQIWLVDVDGSNPHPLRQGGCQADTLQYQPAWSPTVSRLATSSQVPIPGGSARRIVTMQADGSVPQLVTDGSQDTQPTWSADGTHLAFVGRPPTLYGVGTLYAIRGDGTDLRVVTTGSPQHPAW